MLVIFAFYFTEKKYHTVLFSWRENDTDTISLKLCALKRLSTFRYKFVPCWCFQFYSHLLLCSLFVLQWITFPTTKLQACTNIERNCLYINCQANKGQAMFASTPRQYKTQEQANKIAASNMKFCTNCISSVSAMKVPVTQNIRDWMLGSHSPSNMKAPEFTMGRQVRVAVTLLAIQWFLAFSCYCLFWICFIFPKYDLGWTH